MRLGGKSRTCRNRLISFFRFKHLGVVDIEEVKYRHGYLVNVQFYRSHMKVK